MPCLGSPPGTNLGPGPGHLAQRLLQRYTGPGLWPQWRTGGCHLLRQTFIEWKTHENSGRLLRGRGPGQATAKVKDFTVTYDCFFLAVAGSGITRIRPLISLLPTHGTGDSIHRPVKHALRNGSKLESEDRVTKKHFIEFARYILALKGEFTEEARLAMADVVATVAEGDNPRFDRARFLKACGL